MKSISKSKIKEKSGDWAAYLFHEGTNYRSYEYLGAHKTDKGYLFRVWAPDVDAVYLVGDFNDWDDSMPMRRVTSAGIWECFDLEEKVSVGSLYKFKIVNKGRTFFKTDPYGTCFEEPPMSATVIKESSYVWHDEAWLAARKSNASLFFERPLNIYELHLGSWKRHEDGSTYSYKELSAELPEYVRKMGYTHVELMPVMEHPFDGSWGYQVCGYYAPTTRYGSAEDFMGLIDAFHQEGIGVILDWVPAHFPKDAHGLYEFNGSPLYEYSDPQKMEHEGWGTRKFDLGRNEVRSFLISNALYWFDRFHADGIRVDAVAAMLYLDFDRRPGEWTPNIYGDNRCLEAIEFMQKLNSAVKEFYPDVLMIAEESTSCSNITGFENDGLGFDMKWNMGWMNDTLEYAKLDPLFRKHHHEKLTFAMTYIFGERYLLPISHDEVVHGKLSFLDRMPGEYEQKFAGARAFYAYMMTHPGKKLTFMGTEIGQFTEWAYKDQVEWFLLGYDMHSRLQAYFADLNRLYLENPPLWQNDSDWEGFHWFDADNRDDSILSYRRTDREGNSLAVVINFTPVKRENYYLGVDVYGSYKEIFNSDSEKYGGTGVSNKRAVRSSKMPYNNNPFSIKVNIPPMSAVIFKCVKPTDRPKKEKTSCQ